MSPPKEFQEEGLQGIECAQYSAYYAFFKPIRLPFAEIQLLKPVVCLVWGERTKNAILALPHALEQPSSVGNNMGSINGLLSSKLLGPNAMADSLLSDGSVDEL